MGEIRAYVEALERAVRSTVRVDRNGRLKFRLYNGHSAPMTAEQGAAFGDAVWLMVTAGRWSSLPGEPSPSLRPSRRREEMIHG